MEASAKQQLHFAQLLDAVVRSIAEQRAAYTEQ